jgi:phosphatidylserine decarboxylase
MIIEYSLFIIFFSIISAIIISSPKFLKLDYKKTLIIGFIGSTISIIIFTILSLYDINIIKNTLISFSIYTISIVLTVLIHFFRNPTRIPPKENNIILSPADGKILYIKPFENGNIPKPIKGKKQISITDIAKNDVFSKSNGIIIGIGMTLFDVHINRTPINGKVIYSKHYNGINYSAKNWLSEINNERHTSIITNDKLTAAIIQIGTPLVSKVICKLGEGTNVEIGEIMGNIRFGSQVDLIISPTPQINVSENDQVYAGKTILAKVTGPT